MRVIIIFLIIFFLINNCYAMDWKKLHSESANKQLGELLKEAQSNPGSFEANYSLALAYLSGHQDEKAGEIFEALLKKDKDNIGAKWGIAEVKRRKHDLKQSEELLEEILKERPDFPPALITQAYIKYTNRDFDGAVRAAKTILSQGQENVDLDNYMRAHLMIAGAKGMIAHFGGPISKAINGTAVKPHLNAAERLNPDSPEVKFGMGSFYLLAPSAVGGNKDKAKKYLTAVIEADPLFADAYVRLGQLYKITGNERLYNANLEKALSIDPKNQLANDIKSGACKFICI